MTDQEPPSKQLLEQDDAGDLASVSAAEHDGALVVTIAGEIDISNIDAIAGVIHAQPNSEEGLVIDLTQVTYLDSSALSLLHDLAMRLRNRAQRLIVVSPPGSPPRRILELTALYTNAPVADVLADAIRMVADTSLP